MVGHKSAKRAQNLKKGWAIVQNALKVFGNIWDGMEREDKILDAIVFVIIYFCNRYCITISIDSYRTYYIIIIVYIHIDG